MKKILLCLLFAGCASIDPHNMIGRQFSPDKEEGGPLTQTQRETAFMQVVDTIEHKYINPKHNGVDWQAHTAKSKATVLAAKNEDEFWLGLDRMVGVLGDAHARVASPKQVARLRAQEIDPLGITLMRHEGKFYLRSVHPNSDFAWVGARAGMEVIALNGEDIKMAYERTLKDTKLSSTAWARERVALREMILFQEQIALTLAHQDGSRFVAHGKGMKLNQGQSATHRVMPGNVGYLRWTGFSMGLEPALLKGLEELKDTKGLIIDLRNNGGGALQLVKNMAEQLFEKPTELSKVTTRTGQPVRLLGRTAIEPELKVSGKATAYQAPIIILVNENSASASEAFSGSLQAVGRAKVMGATTCGCLLGYLGTLKLSGGGELAYSEVGFVLANGEKVEGKGVVPDLPRQVLPEDIRVNRDRVLEDALFLMSKQQ